MDKKNPKIVLAGSVNSSRKTLEKLIEHEMNITGVLGLSPSVSKNVSGYVDLEKLASKNKLKFSHFNNINDNDTEGFVKECEPDYLFVTGLSQLVKKPLLSIPESGCVGFHPTKLPEGRGRGAVAWLILDKAPAAATFFIMREGMDDGPILVQEEFKIAEEDYAMDVIHNIVEAIGSGLDRCLPMMKKGKLNATEQDHSRATYLGKRNPEDGKIDWSESASDIHRLIRAVSDPLPGAFTYYDGMKVMIERATIEHKLQYTGVNGSILLKDDEQGILVQSGSGLLWMSEFSGIDSGIIRVGQKFGMCYEDQILALQKKFEFLKGKND
jgi:methionyl-tRNA formyltransferase